MNRSFVFKVAGIFFLTLMMSWALSYINSLILERQARQQQVKNDVSNTSAREQTIVGPVLVVPYVEEFPEIITNGKERKVQVRSHSGKIFILPEDTSVNGTFTNEIKSLGIYKALLYQFGGKVEGKFRIPKNLGLKLQQENSVIKVTEAYVSVGISDTRGLIGKPILNWRGQPVSFQQGSMVDVLGAGIHAPIKSLSVADEQTLAFDFKLNIRGTENFHLTPIAENNNIALKSGWQSPHFYGSFTPDASTQKVNENGFTASWTVSSLSSNNQTALMSNLRNTSNHPLESLSVGFVEPINVYSQADRATKYGLLFIGLTFAGFFIFEILKRLRIHPAQYTLVGLAMALFYLLLISLSEHISFGASYLIASLTCIALLGYYLTYVLKSKTHGLLFASLLTALYSALYGILASEDNALLMGSLLVFGLLALTMIITRKVDWYQISSKPETPTTHASYDAV